LLELVSPLAGSRLLIVALSRSCLAKPVSPLAGSQI